ncbi:MAG: ribonuclease Y [Nitrospinaceae bacterium]
MHIFFTIKVNFITLLIGMFVALLVGYAIGYFLRKIFTEYQIKETEELGKKILKDAENEARNRLKSAEIEAKEKHLIAKSGLEKEIKEKRDELREQELIVRKKDDEIKREAEKIRDLGKNLESKLNQVGLQKQEIEAEKIKYRNLIQEEVKKLEVIGSFTADQAKEEIKQKVLDEAKRDAAKEVKKIEEHAKSHAEEEARRLITMAVQRIASDHVAETTVSVVELPNDEIKGRIIGREGRNIRALEQCTGIDLIIDDTPGAVVLSGFDAIRREVARRALEKLTQDGRIHPGRIEDVVNKCKKEITQRIQEAGEQAILEVGIDNIAPDMIRLLGRLKYRTSYTQNVLEHVKEVAWICGSIAAELGLDVQLAKRAGLLHDIGKAIDHQTDGTHTQLGVEVAKRYNEHKYVINAIAAHHEDVEPESLYSVLVAAADTISASRPGARREMLETYVKRMTRLEEIGDSYKGVEKTYAIQAGREVRIIVLPEGITDDESNLLAKDVAKRIEKEVTYPGEIKITVVREKRFTEFAR